MLKANATYKGYAFWKTSDNIIMLHIPNAKIGTTHHALSFDNGETWCIGNNQNIIYINFKGTFTEAIDVCVELNKELVYEEQ